MGFYTATMAAAQGSFRASWSDALREWRKNHGGVGNPRKGSPQYEEVARIYQGMNPDWKPRAPPAQPRPSRVAKLTQELADLGLEVKHRDSRPFEGGTLSATSASSGRQYAVRNQGSIGDDPNDFPPQGGAYSAPQNNVRRPVSGAQVEYVAEADIGRRRRGPGTQMEYAAEADGDTRRRRRGPDLNPPEVLASIGSPPPAPGAAPRVPEALSQDEAEAVLASLEGANLPDRTLKVVLRRLGL